MNSWHSYPSVFQLGHKAIEHLFDDPVLISEKIDGSQFSFGVFDGELKCRSKGKQLVLSAPEKMFIKAIETAKKLESKLVNGWTYRGEYLNSQHHNTLSYGRTPLDYIIIFDINTGNENYLSPDEVKAESERIGLECVPYFTDIQNPNNLEEIKKLLEKESCLGGTKIEGVVFKNYKRFGQDKKVLMGKYVSDAFKEIHQGEWKKKNPDTKDIITQIVEELKTEARWNKSIQHLREQGKIEDSPKDIGALLVEIKQDIKKECVEHIKQRLYDSFQDRIMRGCISGFPEWYKEKLAEKQFDCHVGRDG